MTITVGKKLFNNKLIFLHECKKKIERYTNIINNYDIVHNHVYEKKKLYEEKLITTTEELDKFEQHIIKDTEDIISWIKKYMDEPKNCINLLATERYQLLKSSDYNKNMDNEIINIKEKQLTDEINRIFEIEKNICEDISATTNKDYYNFSSSCFYDYLSCDVLEKENLEKIKEINKEITKSLNTIEQSVNVIKGIKEKIYNELRMKEEIFEKQRFRLIDERMMITSNVEYIIKRCNYLYYDLFDEDLKKLFQMNMWNILENKKLDRKKLVYGKKYLENYIDLFYPEFKETYEKFIRHFYAVKKIYFENK